MQFVDQDVVVMYTLYLIKRALIRLISNSAQPMNFLKDVCESARSARAQMQEI